MIDQTRIETAVEARKALLCGISDQVWEYAELSHREVQSAELLCRILEQEGFTVERGVCGEATAFVASYGKGKPVIGLLGEYDALPDLSQDAEATRKSPESGGKPGHGCGHNLLGVGSLGAALAVQDFLKETKLPGTIRYYGCAAEEYLGVKPYMARDGYFRDVDCVFAWHPETYTGVPNLRHYAAKMFTVAFYGKTAHAGASPHLGRSALDACELMNVGCNYLREHITSDARVHYAYENAGNPACNIVPDYCKMTYGVRALKIRDVREIVERVKNVGRGAALMTDTRVEFQSVMGYSDFFQNTVIASILSDAMNEIGAPQWAESDYHRAAELIQNYDAELSEALEDMIHQRYPQSEWEQKKAQPLDTAVSGFSPTSPPLVSAGSTDVGDVAYAVPTAYMFVACCNMAAPGHSWYMTGNAGGEIGHKGMLTAGKILALACAKVFAAPQLLEDARQEWKQTTGGHYECPMPNESGGME